MLAVDCLNVGLFCNAICCSSSSVTVFCSGAGVWARPGKATTNKAHEKQSTNRVAQLTAENVSTLTPKNFTGVIKLFMFLLHSRHVHLHWLIAFLLFSKLPNLVVFVWRQHAYERHHSRHETAPAGTQAEVFRFVDHLIHRHHGTFHEGILRKARHGIRILAHTGLTHLHPLLLHARHVGNILVLYWIPGFQRRVRNGLLRSRTVAQSATQARTVLLRCRAPLPQHSHASFHIETRGHSGAA